HLGGASAYIFFQAEDGIRDRNVTAVQTCALPIFPVADLRDLRNRIGHHHRIWLQPCAKRHQQLLDLAGYIDPELRAWIRESSARSEERRVGEEWKAQASADRRYKKVRRQRG